MGIRESRQEAFTTEHGHAGTAPGNWCNPRISEWLVVEETPASAAWNAW